MAACGLSPQQCCMVLSPLSLDEFEQYYRQVYDTGLLEANLAVGSAILSAAADKTHPQFAQMATFWMRARGGWRDIRSVETTTKDLPEEQKQKLINQIIDRLVLTPEKAKDHA